MTASDAQTPGSYRPADVSVDELFDGVEPMRSAADLACDDLFEDGEVQEFLAELSAMRHADVV
jgi:hypothetical protein